ncbi:MAG TPA: 16S rRNA (guanine(966)-N(2))-methyltransferase RsmD [Candidatus Limnocylindrales bacterium]|nr:16S rRNA (guanine(966)-N(2))-methyltransferase RsmD [Candidatus Limnocylindrales bacterium]
MPRSGTRVQAGTHRGRTLRTRPGPGTRPTTALVREAIFNIIGESIRGARVLDLFAGSGSVGIEALSRGAERVTFVDSERTCVNIVSENLASTGFAQRARVACAEATDWLRAHHDDLSDFNLIVVDPPYHDAVLDRVLTALDAAPLRSQALVLVEHHRSDPLPPLQRLTSVRSRDYGTTRLSFLRSP